MFVAMSMCFGLSTTTIAFASSNEKSISELKAELIYYYKNGNSNTDVLRTLDAIKSISEDEYNEWKKIIDYWGYTENSMVENIGVAPDGLPDTNTHAFVVLGYALNRDRKSVV